MAKAFSVASWNVEQFWATNKGHEKPTKPIGPIIDFLAAQKADIVAVYEVVGKVVFTEIVKKMPDYQFHIKAEFKSGEALLRLGAKSTYGPSDFNHVLAANHLQFKKFCGFGVDVRVWSMSPLIPRRMPGRKSFPTIHCCISRSRKHDLIQNP